MVKAGLLWPRRSLTTFTGTPAVNRMLAWAAAAGGLHVGDARFVLVGLHLLLDEFRYQLAVRRTAY